MGLNLDFLDEMSAVLDSQGVLRFEAEKNKAFLKIKNMIFDEEVLVYNGVQTTLSFPNELRDIVDIYYQGYYELMEETFKPYEEMNMEDIALGIACGLRIFHLYAPAFIQLRQLMNRHYKQGELTKPHNWYVTDIKGKDNYKYIYRLGSNSMGNIIYTYDDYTFPEEVFKILDLKMGIIEKYPEKIKYEMFETDAWIYKEGRH